ncbi:MAG: cupin domain-containing protein [Thermoanaerobaculia bacterium]
MEYGHFRDVPLEKVENAEGASIQWLIKKEDGAPNFALRRIILKEGGCSPHHSHNYEHEIYVLSGKGKAFIEEKEYPLEEGSFILIKPNLKHQIKNTGNREFVFLCIVPL